MENAVVEEPEKENLIILPAHFGTTLKPNASVIITEAKKQNCISTREIAAMLPKTTLVSQRGLKTTMLELKNFFGALGITIAKGKIDFERRKLPLPSLAINKPSLALSYGKLNELDLKFVQEAAQKQVEFNDSDLALYENVFRKYPLLNHEESIELVKARDQGDLEAHYRLILHNIRLALSWARKYLNRGIDLPDLLQIAIMGLMTGIEKFDWTKGNHLSTYVSWWIKQNIGRAIMNEARGIRIPVHVLEKYYKIVKVSEKIRRHTGSDATNQQIADELKVPERYVVKILERVLGTETESLDVVHDVGDDGSSCLYNTIADSNPSPSSALEAKEALEEATGEVRMVLIKVASLPSLDERYTKVFRMRYGLDGTFFSRPTLEDVGVRFGVTRERIRQMVNIVWDRLQAAGFRQGNDEWFTNKLEQVQELESVAGTFARI